MNQSDEMSELQLAGLSKIALVKADPDTRAFTLVGAFMGYFALLEAGIDIALGEVLELHGASRAIVTRNMAFDDKIKTFRSLVDLFLSDRGEAKRFDELARRARSYGEKRNVVAHTPFRASPKSDGVEFLAISATSTLKFPDVDWSIDEFLRQIDDINTIDNALRSIKSKMSLERIARALARPDSSKKLGGLFGLGAELLSGEAKPDPIGSA
ncbi:hypothetical protein HJB67_22405 [Rhizobium lentis]|uniref:hypothetical protein n=1 Tax=Rhizobium lentis TaxID=1138194 RepID=UPI001C8303A4|nr:hypothetical protein [Rhizobium lentis]MBX5012692.1 hypothetical protein [Rhizobium lentis]